jgi:hypothetical protein
MKIRFTLANVTGFRLFACFSHAIGTEGVGFDPDFEGTAGSAALSPDGRTWKTAFSGFSYEITNPDSHEPAVVEYVGAHLGFLAQNLLPEELRGPTTAAEVTEGSALEKHGVEKFSHSDATVLASAYRLMQTAHKGHPGRDNPFGAAIAAVEAAREIWSYMLEMGIPQGDSWASAEPGTGHGGSQRNDGDPSVYVVCCPGGRQVKVEFKIDPSSTYLERDRKEIVEHAKAWLDRLRPVLDLTPPTAPAIAA